MSSYGPYSASAYADDPSVGTLAWTLDGDGGTASEPAPGGSKTTHYLKATDFSAAVPTEETISGILVEIQRSAASIDPEEDVEAIDNIVQLVVGGAVVGNNKAVGGAWPQVAAYQSYGGDGDLWGTSLAPADVNASDFGVAISASILFPDGGGDARAELVRITIFTGESPGGGPGPGGQVGANASFLLLFADWPDG